MFSQYVSEQLGHYVYLLIDPRDNQIFYVGKGVGNRVFAHASASLADPRETDKLERIRAIVASGFSVRHELLRFGMNERAAFEVESSAIDLLGLEHLSNAVSGHHAGLRGRMTTEVAVSMFDAPPVNSIKERVILFRIPKLWYPAMPAGELFEITRGWWKLGPRREQAEFGFSVSKGVIREVYRIESWRERGPGDRDHEHDLRTGKARWGFEGSVAEDLSHYRNRSVAHLFKPGEASPAKYVNC